MNLGPLDWLIFIAMYAAIFGAVLLTKTHMKSVVDYLAAGRHAGRYLITISAGIAGLGAITVVANLEAGYESGFALGWWGLSMAFFQMLVAVIGWVDYRFRQTRALTLAEFFERRYSRRFRIFAGTVAFLSGLINFGIFPAVGARFFIYFMGLPQNLSILGMEVPSFSLVMFILLGTAVYFVLAGGQIAVMITDFIQGAFANLVFVILGVYLLMVIGWPQVVDVLIEVPPGHSKINPFDTGYVADFNFVYFLIGLIGMFYGAMSWQGTQAYRVSAKSAHEAKMGLVLGLWRGRPMDLFMGLIPILVFTVMHHPEWLDFRLGVEQSLSAIENEAVRNQMRAPIVLARLLPAGLMGAFAALMLGAFVSTHNTYLHSWSSIFVQDVVLPFRKTPLSPAAHIRFLRLAVVGVAVFIFLFSLLYKQSQAILLFFALTGAIFAGWSGSVIIGGLYTRWGNTTGAWFAGVSGVTLTLGGFILEQARRSFEETGRAFWGLADFAGPDQPIRWAEWVVANLPNGQVLWGYAMWVCSIAYIVGSFLGWIRHRESFDLDRLLHRGRYADPEDVEDAEGADGLGSGAGAEELPSRGWRVLAMGKEFSRGDRILYILTYAWNIGWVIVFAIGTTYFLSKGSDEGSWAWANGFWIQYWHVRVWIDVVLSVVVVVWLTTGGIRDVRVFLSRLRHAVRDDKDDGFIEEGESLP